jgi:hypothetical protein
MIPYETLKVWLAKCQDGLEKVITAQDVAVKTVRDLERQRATVEGQIYILEELMNIEDNPPTVELPYAKENIQEMYDQRLTDRAEERSRGIYEERQEKTYKREAMDTAHQIDHVNRTEKESNISEGDS